MADAGAVQAAAAAAGLTAEVIPSSSNFTILRQGAEARVYDGTFMGKRCILKERFRKSYRLPELDKRLTRERHNMEVSNMSKCQGFGVQVPAILFDDRNTGRIVMEYVEAPTLRDYIERVRHLPEHAEALSATLASVGQVLGKMHENNIIHGDLTTSNMLRREGDGAIVMIDFGLSAAVKGKKAEDKGVDLYVLERAFASTHPNSESLFAIVLGAYERSSDKAPVALSKLEEVRARGRKRNMLG
eukprot:m.12116 g.12116  ORF g.12116 m.12116 type:complete len:244 (+) comp6089_c0_seq2:102-833(+)